MKKTYSCSNGHGPYTIAAQVLGKLGGALVGGLAGGATQNPWAVVLGIVAGMLIGHAIDDAVLPTCPECGVFLRIVGESYL